MRSFSQSLTIDDAVQVNDPTLPATTPASANGSKIERNEKRQTTTNDDNGSSILPSKFHIVFSTSCSIFQDWQSYIFFYQISKSGQTGDVTRVVSGCNEQDAADLQKVFHDQIKTLPTGERFHLHLTPDYGVLEGINYVFFNKPHGLLHWMEHALDWPNSLDQYEDTIVVVLDPDMLVLRPFEADYSGDETFKWHGVAKDRTEFVVKKGRPFGQYYAFGSQWVDKANKDLPRIVKAALDATQSTEDPSDPNSSPVYHWSKSDVLQSYVAGPPYIAVASDLYLITKLWAAVAVPVKQLTDDHLSEMHAYSIGAAHAELPHTLGYSFMVSSTSIDLPYFEGWDMIDAAAPEDVCRHVHSDIHTDPAAAVWAAKLPNSIHYCQSYSLGPYFFFKRSLPQDIFSCEKPLLKNPLDHEGAGFAAMYTSSVLPNSKVHVANRQAFMLCYIITILNDALTYWKQQHCTAEDNPNFSKEIVLSQ